MAMVVPGNPYQVTPNASPTGGYGLVEMPEAKYSTENSTKKIDEGLEKIHEYATNWVEKQRDTQVADYSNQIKGFYQTCTNDPELGFKSLKGKNAIVGPDGANVTETRLKEWDTYTKKLTSGIKDPVVRERVKQAADATRLKYQDGLNRHVTQQSIVYRNAVDEESLDIATHDALSDDLEDARGGEMVIKEIVDSKAKQEGVPADYTETLGKVRLMRVEKYIDAGQFQRAKDLLDEDTYMSAVQKHRGRSLLLHAGRATVKKTAENVASNVYQTMFSPESMALRSVAETTGVQHTPDDYQGALALANGDEEKAVQILAYGVDRYEEDVGRAFAEGRGNVDDLVLEDSKEARRALDHYRKQAGDDSFESVVAKVMELIPGIDPLSASNVAKKVRLDRQRVLEVQQIDRDKRSAIAFDNIRKNVSYEDVPDSLKIGLKKTTRQALSDYSNRKAANTLQTDSAVYWDLISDEERLKKMTDEEMIGHSGELSEKDFDEINNYREGLRTGKFKNVRGAKTREIIKGVMADEGLSTPSSKNKKAIYGYVLKAIEDNIVRYIAMTGKEVTPEAIKDETRRAIRTQFFVNLDWGYSLEGFTVKRAVSEGGFLTDTDINKVLDAGLKADGVVDPTKVNRSELLLSISIDLMKPIRGSAEMVEKIRELDPDFIDDIKADFKEKGIDDPTDEHLIRAYFKNKKLFRVQGD